MDEQQQEEELTGYWWNHSKNKLAGIEGYTPDGRVRYSVWFKGSNTWAYAEPTDPANFKSMYPEKREM